MKESKLKFLLDIQLFADPAEPSDVPVEPTEPSEPQEPVEQTVSKKVLDKALSDLAQAKKDLKAKMTDEEAQALALAEKETELQTLRNENKKSKMVAGLSKAGIDEKSINKISDMAIEGDTENLVLAINEAFAANKVELEKELNLLRLESTKRPTPGGNGDTTIKKDISKMSLDELQELVNENPEELLNI